MSSLKVYNVQGSEVGDVEFPDGLMELTRGGTAVHEVIVAYQAAQRAGTAATRDKGEVAGSGKKPWRQKGTGRARAGYRQSPVWRGGGTAFGPKPRSYAKHVNKKVARLAFRRALSDKIAAGAVCVVGELTLDQPKTKAFMAVLGALRIDRPLLVVVDRLEDKLALAARNVVGVELELAASVNVYQLLRYPRVMVNRAGLDQLRARLENGAAK
jgi:large subunit ribosomal protein L4